MTSNPLFCATSAVVTWPIFNMKIRFYKISCTSIEIRFDTAHSVQTVAESVSMRERSEKNMIENEIKIYSNE